MMGTSKSTHPSCFVHHPTHSSPSLTVHANERPRLRAGKQLTQVTVVVRTSNCTQRATAALRCKTEILTPTLLRHLDEKSHPCKLDHRHSPDQSAPAAGVAPSDRE